MAKRQSVTRPPQHKDGEDYGGIEAGISPPANDNCTIAESPAPVQS